MKHCSRCKQIKRADEFNKRKACKTGLRPECKICEHTDKAIYRKKKAKEIADYMLSYNKKYYAENKAIMRAQQALYRAEHKEEAALYAAQYYIENREDLICNNREYRFKNKEKIDSYNKSKKGKEVRSSYRFNNRAKYSALAAKRRAAKLNATPKWLTKEHYEQMENIYLESSRLTKATGILHHVDHILPLQGRTVMGLHVPWNLQILTASENSRKNNKLII